MANIRAKIVAITPEMFQRVTENKGKWADLPLRIKSFQINCKDSELKKYISAVWKWIMFLSYGSPV